MLRLPSFDQTWVDLAHGVRVQHRPATSAQLAAASNWATQEAARTTAGYSAALGGLEVSERHQHALVTGYTAIGLARLCVTAWEGVDAEFTPDALAALMQVPGMVDAYIVASLSALNAQSAEGNVSAPAPSGTSPGAPITAEGAEPQA